MPCALVGKVRATRELFGAHLAASSASSRGGAYTPLPACEVFGPGESGPRSEAIGQQCGSAEEGFRATEKFFRRSGRFSLGRQDVGGRAKGGIARRGALCGERRKQIAKAAAQARWTKDMPHATA